MKSNIIQDVPDYNGIGVYAIINNQNSKKYIGATKDIHARIIQHRSSFNTLRCNEKLCEDIKNGHTFRVEILERLPYGVNQFELFDRENYYIQQYDSINKGYNSAITTCSAKNDLQRSLHAFEHSKEMTAYIKKIIQKREKPITKAVCKETPFVKQLTKLLCVSQEYVLILKSHADSRGESTNAFIKRAIGETMERDNE